LALTRDEITAQLSGQYAIERELGRGGMASVWLARDLRIDRVVALKILHPELAGAIGVDRFAREVRTMAKLTHPNIVPVLESGVLTMDGARLPWYAMPYIDGESLRARLDREPQLPIDIALRVTQQIASALIAAHALGIVHRDIKPENIILADAAAYVVDFGIAKALAETGDERLTSTGIAIGTPAYMSPEQASAGVIDDRTDQYSLACVLYEMLCGEPPFTGPTAAAIIARRFAEAPRPVRTVRSTTPLAVERTTLRALERVPADRFGSVREFATALQSADSLGPRREGLSRRASSVAAVAVLALCATGGWLLLRSHSAKQQRVTDPEIVGLYQRGLRGYTRRTPDGARDAIAAFSAVLARDSGHAGAWNGLAKTYLQAQRRQFGLSGITYDGMLRLAVAAADRAISIDSANSDVWVTRALVSRAIDPTQDRGAIQGTERAIALDSGNAEAWHQLAMSRMELGEPEKAIAAWRESVRRKPTYTEGLTFLAMAHYWHRQFDSAEVWTDSAVTLDASYFFSRATSGYVAVERNRYPKATAAFDAARRVSSDVETLNVMGGRSIVDAREGNLAKAKAMLHEADSMAAQYAPVNVHTAIFLAQGYAAVAQSDSAIRWLERYSPVEDLHFQVHLRCDPPFDPIRRNPRFQALLRRPPNLQGTGC
jgi:tetratricopeptide (TPR) repeat protein